MTVLEKIIEQIKKDKIYVICGGLAGVIAFIEFMM